MTVLARPAAMYWTGGAAKESREIIIFGHESRGTLKEE
jgi:hypothetical protein